MLARTPWVKPVAVKVKVRRLTRDRRIKLIDAVAFILRAGEPTKFALESYCRHSLRSGMCLKGWTWSDADAAADDIVQAALRQLGAVRPSPKEGQPEYTQEGVIIIPRITCLNCRMRLPEGHYRFCGGNCASAYHRRMKRIDDAEADNAYILAKRREWSARQPEQKCEVCEDLFRPGKPGQRFCGKRCASVNGLNLVRYRRKRHWAPRCD